MKSVLFASTLVLAFASHALASPLCEQVSRQVVDARFKTHSTLNPDASQSRGTGRYSLVIWQDDCFYDVDVDMRQDSEQSCTPISAPVLDLGSANCS